MFSAIASKVKLGRNMSIYISLIPYKGKLDKITLNIKVASTDLLAVALLVLITTRDFLGIFLGRLRYSYCKPARAIRGAVRNL